MSLLDKLKAVFTGGRAAREGEAEPPPAPVDPLGTTPGPVAGATPPVTPPAAPRENETD